MGALGAIISPLIVVAAAASHHCAHSIVGTWQLISASSRDAEGRRNDAPFGPSPSGRLIYTADGRMAAIISYSDRTPLSADRVAAPVEERAQAFATSFAYSGRYVLLCDHVVHHVEVSTVPNWVNTEMTRTVSLVGDRLTLGTPPIRRGGTASTNELVWERLR